MGQLNSAAWVESAAAPIDQFFSQVCAVHLDPVLAGTADG